MPGSANAGGSPDSDPAYGPAQPYAFASVVNVVHVGDPGVIQIRVGNVGGHVENLAATVLGASGGFGVATGPLPEIGAGGRASILAYYSTQHAGVLDGSVSLAYASDGSAIGHPGPTPIGGAVLPLSARIDNYARLELNASSGALTHDGTGWVLDLGIARRGDPARVAIVSARNGATGPADLLSGTVTIVDDHGLRNDGPSAFSGLEAGQSGRAETVTMETSAIGVFTEYLDFAGTGGNDSGYSGALAGQRVRVTGTVAPFAPPARAIDGPVGGGARIDGTAGDDVINAHGRDNAIYGHGGNDRIVAGDGTAEVFLGGGDATLVLGGADNRVRGDGTAAGAQGNEAVSGGGAGNDVALGDGADTVSLGGAGNRIRLGNGHDKVVLGAGGGTVTVGDGDDAITLAGDDSRVLAGNGNDSVSGGRDDNTITLGNGRNAVSFSGSGNVVRAGDGDNLVLGGLDGNDVALGDGDDTVLLHGRGNRITLGNGNDKVVAGAGGAVVVAGDGDNAITAGGDDNRITLGDGINAINLDGLNNRVTLRGGGVEMHGGAGDVIAVNGDTLLSLYGGHAETVVLGAGGAFIRDQSDHMTVMAGAATGLSVGTTTITGIADDPGFVLDLTGGAGGYATVGAVLNALRPDGFGGATLSLGAGSIELLGVAPAGLMAAHFRVG